MEEGISQEPCFTSKTCPTYSSKLINNNKLELDKISTTNSINGPSPFGAEADSFVRKQATKQKFQIAENKSTTTENNSAPKKVKNFKNSTFAKPLNHLNSMPKKFE